MARLFDIDSKDAGPDGRKGQALTLTAVAEAPQVAATQAAGALLQAGNALHKSGNSKAIPLWRRVVKEYPNSGASHKAAYNIGYALREQKKYKEAIAVLETLFGSKADDREAGGHIMEAYRNYRHRVCLQISMCYEGLEDFTAALKYAELARDKHTYQTWCGSCAGGAKRSLDERIKRLKKLW